jgi:ABC-type multidrug transport system permease subunit
MKEIRGAVMAGNVIAFVCGLVGVFVMQSALQGDRRLVIAGYRPGEAITARLLVVAAATALVVAVSGLVTAIYFDPGTWPPFLGGLVLVGLIYAALGALAGAVLDRLAATYVMLFLAMTDLGIVQNPMFGDGKPDGWAVILPGYGPNQVMVEGAFSSSFQTPWELLLSLTWAAALIGIVTVVLRRP